MWLVAPVHPDARCWCGNVGTTIGGSVGQYSHKGRSIMRVGVMNDPWNGTLAEICDEVAWATTAGAHTYWLAQVWRYDAFTLIPSLAATAPDLRFATGVAATFHRHPMTMASQALTANLLTGGRFTL